MKGIPASNEIPRTLPVHIAIGGLTALLLGLLALVCFNFYRLNRAEQDNVQAYRILQHTQGLLESLINMETGLRGFTLTGDASFLEPYDQGQQSFSSHYRDALRLTSGSPQQQARLMDLKESERQWQRLYLPVLRLRSLRNQNTADAAQRLAAPGLRPRKKRMDAMRAVLQSIEEQENAELAVREAKAAALRSLTSYTLWGGTAFALLLAAGLAGVLASNANFLRQANQQLQEEIMAREQTTATLRQTTSELQAILRALPDLYFRLAADGTILSCNAGSTSGLDEVLKNLPGRRMQEVLSADTLATFEQAVAEIQRDKTLVTLEYSLVLSDGIPRDYEARLLPLQNDTNGSSPGGDGSADQLVAVVRDITERRKIERMKSEFIATVSHELRTPLTSIRGSLGLLISGVAGAIPDSARSMIEIAHNNSARLVRLINDILDVEKVESGKMEFYLQPLEVAPFLQSALDANRGYATEFQVRFELENALPPQTRVQADPDRLMQVMANLLSNAAKFSPPDEVVTVSARRRAGRVRVEVRDRGAGIPDEFLPQIFSKFAQADSSDTRQKGGTGLGLNISKSIVEKMNGVIGFDTQAGSGTTFYFELPEYSAATNKLLIKSTPGTARRILICEDEEDVATVLAAMLERQGFQTETVADAETAKARLLREKFDGLILDLLLPGQNGVSLIRELRDEESTRDLPIVVVSAKAAVGRQEINGGAFRVMDWIEKPVDEARLLSSLRQAISISPSSRPRILHVEDDPDVQRVVAQILAPLAEVTPVTSVAEAEQLLGGGESAGQSTPRFDLALLDLALPDGSGWHLLSLLHVQKPPVPVVVFSAQDVPIRADDRIEAALVKSRTSNQELLEIIESLLTPPPI